MSNCDTIAEILHYIHCWEGDAMRNVLRRSTPLILLLFITSGCATQPPPINFSVPNVGPSNIKLDAELKSITVSPARPDEATGELDLRGEFGLAAGTIRTITEIWKNSLEEAFIKMAIFKDDSPRKVSLSVKILKYDYPEGGMEMTTHTSARYEIIDRSNGDIIFTTNVSSQGVVPAGYAFLGVTRRRESANRSVQNNLIQFLQALESADLSRPMFPSN